MMAWWRQRAALSTVFLYGPQLTVISASFWNEFLSKEYEFVSITFEKAQTWNNKYKQPERTKISSYFDENEKSAYILNV